MNQIATKPTFEYNKQTRIIGFDPGCRKMLTGTVLPNDNEEETSSYYNDKMINKYCSGNQYYESSYINKSEKIRNRDLNSRWNKIAEINKSLSENNTSVQTLKDYIT